MLRHIISFCSFRIGVYDFNPIKMIWVLCGYSTLINPELLFTLDTAYHNKCQVVSNIRFVLLTILLQHLELNIFKRI